MSLHKKCIAIVPPDGELKKQDFALHRICRYLQNKGFEVNLVKLSTCSLDFEFAHHTIVLPNKEELIVHLQKSAYDLVIHRSWMHAYSFAAVLAENIENIIFYIKDWMVEISPKEYAFVYKTIEDYAAIEKLFLASKRILSHYSDAYTQSVWSQRYGVSNEKFVYFPEFTDSIYYHEKGEILYNIANLRLLAVGGLGPTSQPCEIADGKTFLKNVQIITKQKVSIDKMVLPNTYEIIFSSGMFNDYLYENSFNDYFHIVLGSELNTHATDKYHFGIYQQLYFKADTKESKSMIHADVSKFAYYLEAGLPILVNEIFSISTLVAEYEIGIVVSNNDVKNLQRVLDISQKEYAKLVMNVKEFRKKFSYRDETMKPILEML